MIKMNLQEVQFNLSPEADRPLVVYHRIIYAEKDPEDH